MHATRRTYLAKCRQGTHSTRACGCIGCSWTHTCASTTTSSATISVHGRGVGGCGHTCRSSPSMARLPPMIQSHDDVVLVCVPHVAGQGGIHFGIQFGRARIRDDGPILGQQAVVCSVYTPCKWCLLKDQGEVLSTAQEQPTCCRQSRPGH
jgi:hypothetical protein